jgi:nucleotide-binding universal stress UspA family protein
MVIEPSNSNKSMLVLLAIADEKYGFAIADFVAKHQWPQGSHFYILYVVDEGAIARALAFSPSLVQDAVYKEEVFGNKLVDSVAKRIHERSPVSIEQHIIRGAPQETILETAKNIRTDLIIVGSHGRTALASFLLGSVSMFVVANAKCSVLIVRDHLA